MQERPAGGAGSDEALKRHNRIHITQLPVPEGAGQGADELKAMALPCGDSGARTA